MKLNHTENMVFRFPETSPESRGNDIRYPKWKVKLWKWWYWNLYRLRCKFGLQTQDDKWLTKQYTGTFKLDKQ